MSNCNCEPKTYNIGMGCCQPVLAPIENYYTKWQIDRMIESATTSGCCITPEEVDDKISSAKTEIENEIPSLSGYATEQWVEDKHYITGVDLSDYATTAYVNTQISSQTGDFVTGEQLSSYTYDKSTIDLKIASGGSFDPTQYYNKTEVDNKIASAKTEIEGEIPSLNGYATEQWVTDQNYITGVDLSNYATKSEIPTVPTNVSAFNNDAGYLTEHQSLSAYSTTNEVNNLINQSVSGKASQSDLETVSGDVNTLSSDAVTGVRITTVSTQKEAHIEQARLSGGYSNAGIIYTVGSGLTFDVTNKKIAVDSSVIAQKSDLTTYSAGDGIQISGNTISTTTKFQCLTEQEWASVSGNPDTNTVYFIR